MLLCPLALFFKFKLPGRAVPVTQPERPTAADLETPVTAKCCCSMTSHPESRTRMANVAIDFAVTGKTFCCLLK